MKKLIFTCVVLFCVGAQNVTATQGADLTREQRAKIEKQLQSELAPTVGVFDHVALQLDEKGTVTLVGQVRDPNLKKHAEEDVKKVEGVARVRNQIEVLPISPSDDQIRRAVYNAIYSQNGFERYAQRADPPVHIIVKNGSVHLEGNLATKLEFAQMEAAVKGVPGVFSVQNNVRIDTQG